MHHSEFHGDPEEWFEKSCGTGMVAGGRAIGTPGSAEFIETDERIGLYFSDLTGNWLPTNSFVICYTLDPGYFLIPAAPTHDLDIVQKPRALYAWTPEDVRLSAVLAFRKRVIPECREIRVSCEPSETIHTHSVAIVAFFDCPLTTQKASLVYEAASYVFADFAGAVAVDVTVVVVPGSDPLPCLSRAYECHEIVVYARAKDSSPRKPGSPPSMDHLADRGRMLSAVADGLVGAVFPAVRAVVVEWTVAGGADRIRRLTHFLSEEPTEEERRHLAQGRAVPRDRSAEDRDAVDRIVVIPSDLPIPYPFQIDFTVVYERYEGF